GAGVVALPAFAAVQAGLVPVSPRRLTRDLWLAYHQDLRGSAAVAAMVGFLVDCFAALRA
ncbi:MAG: LysR family transcriptional regulator, partial [Caenispirillum bisanense]|nr:LysR family transcriptional regulator [Caenispirillum bisanense]